MAHPEHEALLLVQADDTVLDQLRHRRSHLKERAVVAAAESAAVAARQEHAGLSTRLDALAADQARLEAELALTEGRADSVDRRMRSGESTAARDIVRWQEELVHLRERASGLEDQAIEVLGDKEAAEVTVAEAEARLSAAIDALRHGRGALTGMEQGLDAELAAVEARRAGHAAVIAVDLLARYERLRGRMGGVAAARLEDGRCTGCHLSLSPLDLDKAKKAAEDLLLTCDACGRMLVRP